MIKTKKGYSNNILDKSDLAYEEESEENGICEFCEGTAVASYDFTGETVQSNSNNNDNNNNDNNNDNNYDDNNDLKDENIILTYNRKGKISSNNITPPIDNEPFKYKRCYQFRESTLRMLNEIKAKHPNINVYLNTIVDEAVRYYYKNIIENNESKG